jgi:hypothetical protein
MLAILMQGCSPEHNWRELVYPQFRVMLPGKPATMTRVVQLEAVPVSLTMHGAKAGLVSYTVSVGKLSAGAPAALVAMQRAMLNNIGALPGTGVLPPAAQKPVPVLDASGNTLGSANAAVVKASGHASLEGKRQSVQMQAYFLVNDGWVYQAVALGPNLDDNQVKTFFDSLRLVKVAP